MAVGYNPGCAGRLLSTAEETCAAAVDARIVSSFIDGGLTSWSLPECLVMASVFLWFSPVVRTVGFSLNGGMLSDLFNIFTNGLLTFQVSFLAHHITISAVTPCCSTRNASARYFAPRVRYSITTLFSREIFTCRWTKSLSLVVGNQ